MVRLGKKLVNVTTIFTIIIKVIITKYERNQKL